MKDPTTDPRIRPFRIAVEDTSIADLHRRIADTRWPGQLAGEPWSNGVPREYLRELAEHWRTRFDWRTAERRINALPQFRTEIDGVEVHFVAVVSPEPEATPLLLTHGWPSSSVEFLDVIGPLTDPARHGGDPADAFTVILPSIPGFGFSAAPADTGWDVTRVARAWAELMSRLGCDRYVAAGGDWGAAISLRLGEIDAEHVSGVHVTMLPTFPPSTDPAVMADLDDADMARLQHTLAFAEDGRGYQKIQATRPQTLSYGLTDSPVGQLAWITEKYFEWADTTDVPEDAIPREHILTQASVFWFTGCAGPSCQIYVASSATEAEFQATWGGPWDISAPIGVAYFRADAVRPVRAWANHTAPALVHWSEFDRGGHFPAVEQPGLLVEDLRRFRHEHVVRSPARSTS